MVTNLSEIFYKVEKETFFQTMIILIEDLDLGLEDFRNLGYILQMTSFGESSAGHIEVTTKTMSQK